ncbi:hypothetical protein [Phormidesmis priestleyi]
MIKTCHRFLAVSFLGTTFLASHSVCAETIAISIQPTATVSFTDLTFDQFVNVIAPIQKNDRILSQAEQPAPTPESTLPEANNPRIPLSSRIFAVSTMQQ